MAEYVVVDKEQLEADLTTIADSIRGLIESEEKLLFPQGMKEAVEGYSLDEPLATQDELIEQIKTALQGKASGGEENLLIYANRICFIDLNLFNKTNVVLDLPYAKECNSMFYLEIQNKTVESIAVNCPNLVNNMQYFMTAISGAYDYTLKKVTINFDTSNVKNWNMAFNRVYGLEVIDGLPFDFSSATNVTVTFNYLSALKEMRWKKNSLSLSISVSGSPLLNNETIQSIIDGLADLTGGTSQTLTLHADVKSKLTETQVATITSKNWTLA